MTMGKGGVGKTSIASALAVELARSGHRVHLSTTDPAAHLDASLSQRVAGLEVSRIDPGVEVERYRADVIASAGARLDAPGRALLEEDLRSPCTGEIAVFRAFAATVDAGQSGFVVLDTAPTGHTLLLLDATRAYHREVLRTTGNLPDSVRRLLPRLQDGDFTRVLLVTLPEATPVHEAQQLERDLQRSGIEPYAWIINQSLTPLRVKDPVLTARRLRENAYIRQAVGDAVQPVVLTPWIAPQSDMLAWLDRLISIPKSGTDKRRNSKCARTLLGH
jgi:arsenite-transporting ATPase